MTFSVGIFPRRCQDNTYLRLQFCCTSVNQWVSFIVLVVLHAGRRQHMHCVSAREKEKLMFSRVAFKSRHIYNKSVVCAHEYLIKRIRNVREGDLSGHGRMCVCHWRGKIAQAAWMIYSHVCMPLTPSNQHAAAWSASMWARAAWNSTELPCTGL